MSDAQFPEDEFDRIAQNLPQGSHRPGQPWWQGFLPFVIALIAAPLLSWAILLLLGSHNTSDVSSGASPSATATPNASASVTPSETASARPTQTPSESPSESPNKASTDAHASGQADLGVSVEIVNAAGIEGLATKAKEILDSKGFTRVVAGNFEGNKPAQNSIYYDAAHQGEAKRIQQLLGIDMLFERDTVDGVYVVLTRDID